MSGWFGRNGVALVSSMISTMPMASGAASATDFSTKAVIAKLPAEQRYQYVAGLIEGLAYSRYERDNKTASGDQKKTDGMICIYDWFYSNKGTFDLINAAFERYPDFPPGPIVAALERKACGE